MAKEIRQCFAHKFKEYGPTERCKKNGTIYEDYKYWCAHHAPSKVKKRAERRKRR